MGISETDAAPIGPSETWFAERRLIVTSLLGWLAASMFDSPAAGGEADIPPFASGRYQFTILRPQRELPPAQLVRLDGTTTELSTLRGHAILLNFWASWCAACRTELPILDQLLKRHSDLRVLAVSEDQADRATVARFVASLKTQSLPIYWDPNGSVASSDRANKRNAPFALYGMPITYLISASGRVAGYMPGAADWDSAEARNLLDYLRRS